jgi:hypothetical protein
MFDQNQNIYRYSMKPSALHNNQDCWLSGFYQFPGILNDRKCFGNWKFSFSGEGRGDSTYTTLLKNTN